MSFYSDLRAANKTRAIEWSNGGDGGEFYAVELFGEAGEALNVVKKLERERLGMVGSRSTMQDMADEIADVIICIDLLAIAYSLPVLDHRIGPAPRNPLVEAIALGRCVGSVMSAVELLESENYLFGVYGYDNDAHGYVKRLTEALGNTLFFAELLALSYGIKTSTAVIEKFNKTSEKYGLHTTMGY